MTKDWTSKRWAKAPMLAALVGDAPPPARPRRREAAEVRASRRCGSTTRWSAPAWPASAKLAGVELIAWTVDDLAKMRKLVERRRRRHLLQRPAPLRRSDSSASLRYIALVLDRKVFHAVADTDPRLGGRQARAEFARSRGYGYGGYGPGRGRGGGRARRGDVRAAVLALLAERPMHGYEMIKEIEERTDGAWTPSAGSIYPTLQLLEDEGLITRRGDRGQAPLHPHRRPARAAAGREGRRGGPLGRGPRRRRPRAVAARRLARASCTTAIGQVFHAADEEQQKRVRELLDETRRKIYAILAEGS